METIVRDPAQRARLRAQRERLIQVLKTLASSSIPRELALQSARDTQKALNQVNKALGNGYAFSPKPH